MDRRGSLQCMAWVGTGAVWTMAGGVLKGMPIEQAADAAMTMGGGLRFAQISDSYIGFDQAAKPDVTQRAARRSPRSRRHPRRHVAVCREARRRRRQRWL